MVGKLISVAAAVTAAAVLAGCVVEQARSQEGPSYQAPAAQVSAAGGAGCYTDQDLSAMRARMTQQVLATGTLSCKSPDGSRLYHQSYTNFVGKFRGDLQANYQDLTQIVARKRLDLDQIVTEMANRTAGRQNEPDFCSRLGRAYTWALSPKVTSLQQVPTPYDFGPEMRMHRCPPGTG